MQENDRGLRVKPVVMDCNYVQAIERSAFRTGLTSFSDIAIPPATAASLLVPTDAAHVLSAIHELIMAPVPQV
jgi:hypothetical protein